MYAIVKTLQRIGFDETSVIVGYADSHSEADYVIYRLAISAQYGSILQGFNAIFSICKV
jgi:hypothetical protein